MENAALTPAPPNLEGLVWRSVDRADLAALAELARACYQADGGLSFLFEPEYLPERFFPDAPGAALGAFTPDRRLAACAAVRAGGDTTTRRAIIAGMVRPDLRNRGIGTYLMRWSEAQAQSLLANVSAEQQVLQVATESLSEPADRLYRRHGFAHVSEDLVMEYDLRFPVPDRALPEGITLANWEPALAGQFFEAYHTAFQERPGFPGWTAAEWIAQVTENDHVPEWALLARANGVPVGFVIGNADLTKNPPDGFVWQIGVVPAARRRGLASALLVETMRRMQAASAASALLTVHLNNPGAIQAYARLGFATVGRRARYERLII